MVDFVIELTKKLQHQRQLVNVSNLDKKGIDSLFRGVFSFFMTASFHLHYRIISLTLPHHFTYITASFHLHYHIISLTLPHHFTYITASFHLHYRIISLTLPHHFTYITASFHLHYRIISLRGEIWAHKTSLTSRHHLLLKYLCPVKPGKWEVMYLCVRGIKPGKWEVMYLC